MKGIEAGGKRRCGRGRVFEAEPTSRYLTKPGGGGHQFRSVMPSGIPTGEILAPARSSASERKNARNFGADRNRTILAVNCHN